MRVPKVSISREEMLNPEAPAWQKTRPEKVKLVPTPLAMQPSPWIRGAFKGYTYGQLSPGNLSSMHNGESIAVRVEWTVAQPASSTDAPNEFTDACAVMLPFVRNAPLETMGTDKEWVNMWLWRADRFGPFAVTAAGLGTTERTYDGALQANGFWRDGAWHVAFVRPLAPGEPRVHVPLKPGAAWQITIALWHGANKERGGLKAYGPKWIDLELES